MIRLPIAVTNYDFMVSKVKYIPGDCDLRSNILLYKFKLNLKKIK